MRSPLCLVLVFGIATRLTAGEPNPNVTAEVLANPATQVALPVPKPPQGAIVPSPPQPWIPQAPPVAMTSFVHRLEHAPAEKVAAQVSTALQQVHCLDGSKTGLVVKSPVVIVPDVASNCLVVAASAEYIDEIKEQISKADVEPRQYHVQVRFTTTDSQGRQETMAPKISTIEGMPASVLLSTDGGEKYEVEVEVTDVTDDSVGTPAPAVTEDTQPTVVPAGGATASCPYCISQNAPKVEQLWHDIQFFLRKGKPKAVAVLCRFILEEYPNSEHAVRAGKVLSDLKAAGDKPASVKAMVPEGTDAHEQPGTKFVEPARPRTLLKKSDEANCCETADDVAYECCPCDSHACGSSACSRSGCPACVCEACDCSQSDCDGIACAPCSDACCCANEDAKCSETCNRAGASRRCPCARTTRRTTVRHCSECACGATVRCCGATTGSCVCQLAQLKTCLCQTTLCPKCGTCFAISIEDVPTEHAIDFGECKESPSDRCKSRDCNKELVSNQPVDAAAGADSERATNIGCAIANIDCERIAAPLQECEEPSIESAATRIQQMLADACTGCSFDFSAHANRAEARISEALKKQITLRFENAPLKEILRHIAETADINIFLDDAGLSRGHVAQDQPVSIHVENITVKSVLTLILDPLGLACHIEDEVLKISTPDLLAGNDVRADFSARHEAGEIRRVGARVFQEYADDASVLPAAIERHAIAPMTATVYSIADLVTATDGGDPLLTPEQLVDLIQRSIEAESWVHNGGPAGVEFFQTTLSLVIRQESNAHIEIARLLNTLRELQRLKSCDVSHQRHAHSVRKPIEANYDGTPDSRVIEE